MERLIAAIGFALVLSGCAVGTRAEQHRLTGAPRGADVLLETSRETYEGELLALRDDGFVVRTSAPNRILQIPFVLVVRGNAELFGRFYVRGGLPAASVERLRLLSRYPQGIAAEVEQSLLRAYGLERFEVVAR